MPSRIDGLQIREVHKMEEDNGNIRKFMVYMAHRDARLLRLCLGKRYADIRLNLEGRQGHF